MTMRDLSHQAGRALADTVTCYALGLILAALLLGACVGVAVGEVVR